MMAVENEWKENKGYKCAFRNSVCFTLELTSSSRRVKGKDYLKCTRSITEMLVKAIGRAYWGPGNTVLQSTI
jgi:hypothetical protein